MDFNTCLILQLTEEEKAKLNNLILKAQEDYDQYDLSYIKLFSILLDSLEKDYISLQYSKDKEEWFINNPQASQYITDKNEDETEIIKEDIISNIEWKVTTSKVTTSNPKDLNYIVINLANLIDNKCLQNIVDININDSNIKPYLIYFDKLEEKIDELF